MSAHAAHAAIDRNRSPGDHRDLVSHTVHDASPSAIEAARKQAAHEQRQYAGWIAQCLWPGVSIDEINAGGDLPAPSAIIMHRADPLSRAGGQGPPARLVASRAVLGYEIGGEIAPEVMPFQVATPLSVGRNE